MFKKTEHRFELKTTDCSTVFFLLSKLCNSKATGLDQISARPLRECAEVDVQDGFLKLYILIAQIDALSFNIII